MIYTWMGVRTLLGTSRNPVGKVSLSQNLQKETTYSSPMADTLSALKKKRLTTSVIVYEAGDCNDNSDGLKGVWISPFLDFDSLIRDVLSHSSRLIGGNSTT